MKRNTIIVAVGLALIATLLAAPAQALSARTFVSPTGSDSNSCLLAAPCRTFQAALAQTNAGGEIAVLGTAGYTGGATLTIDKAISIVNPGAFEAGIVVPSGGTGIVINAGASDAVSLHGLTIDGQGAGLYGIQFNTGASLTVANSVIRNVVDSGLRFTPNATSKLSVSHSLVANNGFKGLVVSPTGSGTVSVMFNRVEANNNGDTGIYLYGSASTGTVKVSLFDSVSSGNSYAGFYVETAAGQAAITLMLLHSVAANNIFGVAAQGSGAIIRLDQSMLTGNTNGWGTASGASVLSYGNNAIDGNTASNTAPPSIALK